jgi:hypothetical protein
MPRGPKGSTVYPLTQQIADSIKAHGLRWAVRHYSRKLSLVELRVLLRGAYVQQG